MNELVLEVLQITANLRAMYAHLHRIRDHTLF